MTADAPAGSGRAGWSLPDTRSLLLLQLMTMLLLLRGQVTTMTSVMRRRDLVRCSDQTSSVNGYVLDSHINADTRRQTDELCRRGPCQLVDVSPAWPYCSDTGRCSRRQWS